MEDVRGRGVRREGEGMAGCSMDVLPQALLFGWVFLRLLLLEIDWWMIEARLSVLAIFSLSFALAAAGLLGGGAGRGRRRRRCDRGRGRFRVRGWRRSALVGVDAHCG